MPGLPPLAGVSRLGASAGLSPRGVAGSDPRRPPPVRRMRRAWLNPALITVRRRRLITAHSMPQPR
jgi:hypothetical protein